jgi:chromosome segregation ATPase
MGAPEPVVKEGPLEFIVTILCAMSGALIGTAVGILLMSHKFRLPSQAELDALRANLHAAESSLAAATAVAENLRKQIAERDRTIHERSEELNEQQRQLGFAKAEAEKAAAQRSAVEQKAHELAAEVAEMAERRAELEARLEEEKIHVVEQAGQRVASYEARLDADRLQIQELGGEVARLTAECTELNARLRTELERSGQLTGQIAELQSDRQSAAKGIELLLAAQQNLSRFLKPACEGGTNGHDGAVPVEAATADSVA